MVPTLNHLESALTCHLCVTWGRTWSATRGNLQHFDQRIFSPLWKIWSTTCLYSQLRAMLVWSMLWNESDEMRLVVSVDMQRAQQTTTQFNFSCLHSRVSSRWLQDSQAHAQRRKACTSPNKCFYQLSELFVNNALLLPSIYSSFVAMLLASQLT